MRVSNRRHRNGEVYPLYSHVGVDAGELCHQSSEEDQVHG
jgi:hypothetical protein